MEAIESAREVMKKPIGTYRALDLISIILMINNILYFNISHVFMGEHEISLYRYISSLLSNEYGKMLHILEIPIFPDFHETTSSIKTNEILLDATKDQIHKQFLKLEPTWRSMIHHYL
jgi:hypothetical protein